MADSLKFLLDTNVVSEVRKPRPAQAVLKFLSEIPNEELGLSIFTVAELRKGAAYSSKTSPDRGQLLTTWIDHLELEEFAGRVLSIDPETARIWGHISVGRTRSHIDTFLAATAIQRDLTLVTRNTRDFSDLPVKLLNPWES